MRNKRNFVKKLLSIILCLTMVLSCVPMTAQAAYDYDEENKFSFRITNLVMEWNGERYEWGTSGSAFCEQSLTKISDGEFQYKFKAALRMNGGTWWSDFHTIIFDGVNCDVAYLKTFDLTDSTNSGGHTMTWTYTVEVSKYKGHIYGSWSDNGDGTHSRSCKINSTHTETANHNYAAATCTAPQTCKNCGATTGEPVADAHGWNAATCVLPATCRHCGLTEGDVLGHEIVAASFGKPAACKRCRATDINVTVLEKALINTNVNLPSKAIKSDNSGYYDITWTVVSAGDTGAVVNGNTLKATNSGNVTIRATTEIGSKDYNVIFSGTTNVDISLGSVTISKINDTQLTVTFAGFEGGSKDYEVGEPIVITGSTTSNKIIVQSGVADIHLNNVTISGNFNNIEIKSGAEANITLSGTNSLSANDYYSAIAVPSGAKVTFDGSGTLNATTSGQYAAIGGTVSTPNAGTIIINGGTIVAKNSSWYGAGIGGGNRGTGGTIIINGGNVTATGGIYAAGIGGGHAANSGIITINGGNVTATGGESAAGIGGGYNGGSVDAITINGGTITAKGGQYNNSDGAAGIGGGYKGNGGTIIITGGNIKATPGTSKAAAIGNGQNGSVGTVKAANGNDVSLNTLTLEGTANGTVVTGIESNVNYGVTDVQTFNDKLYFYLPSETIIISLTAGDTEYNCTADNKIFYSSHSWDDGICIRCKEFCGHNGAASGTCGVCGKTLHTHSWTYSVSADNTRIIATCIADNCTLDNGIGAIVTISAPADLTYDGKDKEASLAFDSWQLEEEEKPSISYNETDRVNVTNEDITAAITLGGQTASVTYQVQPASISGADVTAEDVVYTGQPQTPEVSVVLNGETLEKDKDYTVSDDSYSDHTDAGTATVTVTGIGNYHETAAGTFNVNPAELTEVSVVQSEALSYDGGNALTPVVEEKAVAVNGQTVTFTYSTEENGTYGSMPTFTESGGYTVYYKASAANHEDAYGSFAVTIDAAENSWTTKPSIDNWTYGEEAKTPAAEATYGTVKVNYTGTANDGEEYNSPDAPSKAGNYTAEFTVDASKDYGSLRETVAFAIEKAKVTVTAEDAGKTYGDADPQFGYSNTALVGDDELSGITVSRVEGENAGTYGITASQSEGSNPNYEITFESGIFTIHKAALKVTAEDKEAVYGDGVPEFSVTFEGFKNNDDVSALGGTPDFDCTYVQFADKGDYVILPKGYESDNYTFDYIAGTLTVKAKAINVIIEEKTSIYGDDIAELIGETGGIVNQDTDVYALSVNADKTSGIGKYDITGETLDDNYSITFLNGEGAYEITPRELTVTVVVADKAYDGKKDAVIASAALNNVVNEDAVILVNGEAVFDSVDVAENISITFTEFTLSGEDEVLKNYTLTQPEGVTANITNDWTPAEYSVTKLNEYGWLNNTFTITAEEGYQISLKNTAEGEWKDSFSYSEETDKGSVTFYVKNTETGAISLAATESYKIDKTVPTGTVEFADREEWQKFVSDITFGLFFKEEVIVKAEAEDTLSDVAVIEYAVSDKALTLEEVKDIDDWTKLPENGVAVDVEDAKQFVYFVRITDKAGNVTFLSTDGAVYDTQVPVLGGITDGATCYTTQKFTVEEINLVEVTINGTAVDEAGYVLAGNTDAVYTVAATDEAGNCTTVTVTMKTIGSVGEDLADLTVDQVTADSKDDISEVKEALEDIDVTDATEEEKAEIKEAVTKCEELLKVIEDTQNSLDDLKDTVENVDPETVTSDDKEAVEELLEDLKEELENPKLTEEQKAQVQEQVEAVEDVLDKMAEDQKALEDAIDSQSGVTAENVTAEDGEALEEAKNKLEELKADDNYTEAEKEAIQAEIDRIEELEEIIENNDVTKVFTDVYEDWYTDYIQYVYDHELMKGIEGTTEFRPDDDVTKAQAAQVLYNMEGKPEVTDRSVFTELKDVYKEEWYADAVAWAYDSGIITGDLTTYRFYPDDTVTREQLALMMYRYASYKAYDVSATSDFAGLENADQVSNWSEVGVRWAVGAGLISGIEKDGVKDLAPQGNATRAQVAAILQRFCEK